MAMLVVISHGHLEIGRRAGRWPGVCRQVGLIRDREERGLAFVFLANVAFAFWLPGAWGVKAD